MRKYKVSTIVVQTTAKGKTVLGIVVDNLMKNKVNKEKYRDNLKRGYHCIMVIGEFNFSLSEETKSITSNFPYYLMTKESEACSIDLIENIIIYKENSNIKIPSNIINEINIVKWLSWLVYYLKNEKPVLKTKTDKEEARIFFEEFQRSIPYRWQGVHS